MLTSIAFLVSALIPGEETTLALVPLPTSVRRDEGSFTLGPKTKIVLVGSDPEIDARSSAEYLAQRIAQSTGFLLPIQNGSLSSGDNTIYLIAETEKIEHLAPYELHVPERLGSYVLRVSKDDVQVFGRNSAGLFYGVQTLLQLFPPEIYATSMQKPSQEWLAPCVEVTDAPRFPWRGWMLDVSRHFETKDEVKAFIDELAMHKLNVFHWHLVDDHGWRIEIKKYPKLTSLGAWRDAIGFGLDPKCSTAYGKDGKYGGFYTQDEIKEVVAYATARYITIVPEIEMPGHSVAALAAYPEFSCSGGPFDRNVPAGVHAGIYCPGNDAAFGFVEDVLTEVIALFPSQFIHVGGDEVPREEWQKCAKCKARIATEGLKNVDELQSYFMKRVETFLNSKGRRMIGWDEILDGGLAPNAAVMSWRGIEGGTKAASAGHDVVMSPTSNCYFDFYQAKSGEPRAIGGFLPLETVYAFEPVPPGLNPEQAKHVLGAQGNVWTEYIPNRKHVEYMSWPRECAIAELTWSPKESRNFASFQQRLETHMKRLAAAGVNYRAKPPDNLDQCIWLECAAAPMVHIEPLFKNGGIRYTLDLSEPDANSAVYSGPFAIGPKPMLVKARFTHPGTPETFRADSLFVYGSAQVQCAIGASGENTLERAFDGDPKTFFWTDGAPGEGELLRIHFCAAHRAHHMRAVTGDADKPQDFVHQGMLEFSSPNGGFNSIAPFKDGVAEAEFPNVLVEDLRIRLTKGQDNWVRIHEIVVE